MNHGSSASLTPRSGSVTGSGSDSHEGPLPRKHRVGSTTSVPDARFSPIPLTHQMSIDEPMHSPTSTQFDERSPAMQHASPPRRRPTWGESRGSAEPGSQHLPSLSDVFSDSMTGVTRTSDGPNGFPGFVPGQSMHGPPQPQPPPLKHEQSAGSMGSSSSGVSYPRTPSDASLPILALLSNKAGPLASGYGSPPPPYYGHGAPAPNEQRLPFPPMSSGPSPHGMANGHFSPPPLMKYASTGSSGATEVSIPSTRTSLSVHDSAASNGKSESTMDGMNALLRAGEIVGRRN